MRNYTENKKPGDKQKTDNTTTGKTYQDKDKDFSKNKPMKNPADQTERQR